jgi:hypothetical protein
MCVNKPKRLQQDMAQVFNIITGNRKVNLDIFLAKAGSRIKTESRSTVLGPLMCPVGCEKTQFQQESNRERKKLQLRSESCTLSSIICRNYRENEKL